MSTENQSRMRYTRAANLRALRALRIALTVLHDAWQDIAEVSWDSELPEEVRATRTKEYNILKPLLVSAGRDIRLLPDDPVLAESCLATTLAECNEVIELRLREISDESKEELMWKIRKVQKDLGLPETPQEPEESKE